MPMMMNGLEIPAGAHDQVYENLAIQGTWTGPVVKCEDGANSIHKNIKFRRCFITAKLGATPKWAFRPYDMEDSEYEQLVIEQMRKEHAFYLNVIGRMRILRCRVSDVDAQGVQIAWRINETSDKESYKRVGLHSVEQCNFTKVGLPNGDGRRSYVLTFFGKQVAIHYDPVTGKLLDMGPRSRWDCPVLVKDTVIDNRAIWTPQLRGGIVVEHRPLFELLGGSVSHDGVADRPLVHSYKNDIVRIDGTRFHGNKQVNIEGAKDIDIANCTGNVQLVVDGVKIGPISNGFRLSA